MKIRLLFLPFFSLSLITTALPSQVLSTSEIARKLEKQGTELEFLREQLRTSSAELSNLRSKLEALEARMLKLEGPGTSPAIPPVVGGDAWKSTANWRRLKVGMSENDVRKILGEPFRIEGGRSADWFYDPNGIGIDARVYFSNGKVDQWREPSRTEVPR